MDPNNTPPTALDDGQLTREQALSALSAAAAAAASALSDALLKCESRDDMRRVSDDRDTCQLAYSSALVRSLKHTGPLFEKAAVDLEAAAAGVAQKAKSMETAAEAVGLFADLVRLSSKLALAFA